MRVGWPLSAVLPAGVPVTHKGFTLLELLVVMVIIGMLAGFVAPRYFAQVGKSQVKAARAQIDAFDKAWISIGSTWDAIRRPRKGSTALMARRPGSPTGAGPT